MDYEKHLLKLIQLRNEKELGFKTIIDSHNKLWRENQLLVKENKDITKNLDILQDKIIKMKELYNIVIDPGNIVIKDNYF